MPRVASLHQGEMVCREETKLVEQIFTQLLHSSLDNGRT
jgi:hypothetical protein